MERMKSRSQTLFAWLLNRDETHKLGDGFVRIFVEEINRGLEERRRIAYEPLSVRQEVDTSGSGADIADLVLEGAGPGCFGYLVCPKS